MTEDAAPKSLRILVIVSRPLDLPDLPNLADQWALQSGLRRVQAPAYLKMLRPPTVEGLRTEILNGYDIVHFDGHGAFGRRCPNCGALNGPEQKQCSRCDALLEEEKASGYFAFEREDGLLDALAAKELAEMAMSAPDYPAKLVFLSACESAKGGEASLQNVLLKSGVPAVLGMNESVPLAATVALAGPFYAGLGAGMAIDRAFKNALPALKRLENGSKLPQIMTLEGPGKEARILTAKTTGKASFEAERLFGLPEQEFVGDYIRADPPRGRKGLLSQAMEGLQCGEKLVALTGQGGIGKTVLAAEAARRLAWRYPGGVFWRSAADIERLGLEEMLNAFDNVFGPQFRPMPLDAKRDSALSYLRNYDTASLLVVDNAESIKDEKLWRFLEGIPEASAALVTTRESLPREGKEIRIPEMEPGESGRLLLLEARRRSPRWGEHLSPKDLESLQEIAGVMKGHPLAIKLTAALLVRRSLSGIRDELRRNPPQEVSQRFDVSFNSLSEGQKDLFCRLAVFSSSVTEEAVGRIYIEDEASDWQSDLGELERRSFLDRIEIPVQDEDGNEVALYRYKLHPLMRQYAAAKAGEELLARLRPRAAAYFLGYAWSLAGNFFMLGLEHENLLAAMDWFAASQESSSGNDRKAAENSVLLIFPLGNYLDTLGYWKEYDRCLRQAITAAEIIEDRNGTATLIQNLAVLDGKKGDYNESLKLCRKSLEIYKELGNKRGMSSSLHTLANLAYLTGELEESSNLYQQSLKIDQELGDKSSESKSLHQLGMLAESIGEYDKAKRLYQQSLEISMQLGDKKDVSMSLGQQGRLAQVAGDYDEARNLYLQSLKIQMNLGDKSGMSISLLNLSVLAQATGDFNQSRKLCQQSLEIKKELGDKSGVASSLHQLGMLAQATGDCDEARKLYLLSLEIAMQLGDKSSVSKLLHQLGVLAQATSEYDQARKLYQQSLEIKQDLGDKSGVALSQAQMALLEEQMGNAKAALHLIRQAEAAFLDLGSPYAKQAKKDRQRLEQKQ